LGEWLCIVGWGSGFGTFVYSSSICVAQVHLNVDNMVMVNLWTGRLVVSDWL